ncbi:GDSL family lipase [Clostridium sartagoforme]|uniref:GDSL family lipase n=1 Tax=Clostridium sartagoforme TaxID=84031 RepID=A0A4S2DIC1_9CLOT|nr:MULTISPECIES: GDSL-type esterase/lipase family protein [Clostridium]MBS5939839.1 GDSL family lipase [Clostridium sp.]MBS5951760.1 GDSL family lipase [Clostridium sp.]TGY40633.1 GDSL family lipase [Clostridium sartagoforme]
MQNKNYVFIGDSLTFGYGVSKNKSWIEFYKEFCIEKGNNINIINKGINGNTTTDMLNRFTEDVTSLNPSTIFIMGGTNDLLSNRAIDSIIDNIDLMIQESLTCTDSIIIGIPPRIIKEDAYRLFMPSLTYDYCEKSLPKLREILIKLCNKYKLKYIDFYDLTSSINHNEYYIDGIHFNENGHKLLFNEFIKN